MKDLHIPDNTNTSIDLSQINSYFKGLIICYKDDKAVGYVQYWSDSWHFMTKLNDDYEYQHDFLFDIIQNLIEDHKCTNFKVIEFE